MASLILIGMLMAASGDTPENAETAEHHPTLQYVNWRELRLPCKYGSEGTAPVTGLRLWWTDDNGHSWQVYPLKGTLAPQPYIAFTVPADGTYGFYLQAVDDAGNTSGDPVPGEPVPLSVVVDTTPPELEILTPGREEGFDAGQVVTLQWAAHDTSLADAPVRICFIKGKERV